MKKLFTLLLMVPFLFAACSSDDDKELDKALVGKWSVKEYKLALDVTPAEAYTAIAKSLQNELGPHEMEFKTDGTHIFTDLVENDVNKGLAWTEKNKLHIKYNDKRTLSVDYRIINNTLELSIDMKAAIMNDLDDILDRKSVV